MGDGKCLLKRHSFGFGLLFNDLQATNHNLYYLSIDQRVIVKDHHHLANEPIQSRNGRGSQELSLSLKFQEQNSEDDPIFEMLMSSHMTTWLVQTAKGKWRHIKLNISIY